MANVLCLCQCKHSFPSPPDQGFYYFYIRLPNDQDQRGEPEGMDGRTAIVEASAESTCWAAAIINESLIYPSIITIHRMANVLMATHA
jgi:hypothetical protein